MVLLLLFGAFLFICLVGWFGLGVVVFCSFLGGWGGGADGRGAGVKKSQQSQARAVLTPALYAQMCTMLVFVSVLDSFSQQRERPVGGWV